MSYQRLAQKQKVLTDETSDLTTEVMGIDANKGAGFRPDKRRAGRPPAPDHGVEHGPRIQRG